MANSILKGRCLVSVAVTVECGSWGPDCALQQAYEQGAREAEEKVRRLLQTEHGVVVSGVTCARVVIDAPKKGE
jgi:predicted small metal-binding protein